MQHAHRTQQKIPHGLLTTSQLPTHEPPPADMVAKELLKLSQAPWNGSKVQVWPQGEENLQYNSLAQLRRWLILSMGSLGNTNKSMCLCQPCHSLFLWTQLVPGPSEGPWGAESSSTACDSTWHSNGKHPGNSHQLISPLVLCHIK